MREDAFTTLRVVNRAASKVSADGNSNDAWRRKSIVGAPADQRQLVAQLHHGGPDVIEELNLHHRLQPARSHTNRASDDIRLSQRRIENPVAAKVTLQTVS